MKMQSLRLPIVPASLFHSKFGVSRPKWMFSLKLQVNSQNTRRQNFANTLQPHCAHYLTLRPKEHEDKHLAICCAMFANLVATPLPCQAEETLKKPRSSTLSTLGKKLALWCPPCPHWGKQRRSWQATRLERNQNAKTWPRPSLHICV